MRCTLRTMLGTYGRTWWESLAEYPVWPPGSPVRTGDYGTLEHGCFKRLGHASEYARGLGLEEATAELDTLSISRRGTKTIRTNAALGLAAAASQSEVRFEFGQKQGIVFFASGIRSSSVLNLNVLAARLAEEPAWDRSWLVVTTLRTAERFSLLAAQDGNVQISVRGSSALVEDFLHGRATADAGLEFSGDRALHLVGSAGPVSVQLHRLAWFGNRFRNLQGGPLSEEGVSLVPFIDPIEQA